MDVFFEQLIKSKNSTLKSIARVLLWIICIGLSAGLLFMGTLLPTLSTLLLPLAVGVILLAWWLGGKFTVEYEYILTNGEVDIDRIIAKKKRARMLSFRCSEIEKYGKTTDGIKLADSNIHNYSENGKEEYYAKLRHSSLGNITIVFSPNERFRSQMKKFIKRQVQHNAENWD